MSARSRLHGEGCSSNVGENTIDVVDVNQAGLPLEPRKDYIDGPLERRRFVCEPKKAFS